MAGLTALLIATPLGLPWLIAICVIPIGAGGSLAMPSVTSVVLEGVPAHQAGTASAVFNTFRPVGGAVAIAVFGALIDNPDTIDRGLRLSLGIAAVLILLAALNSLRTGHAPRSRCKNRWTIGSSALPGVVDVHTTRIDGLAVCAEHLERPFLLHVVNDVDVAGLELLGPVVAYRSFVERRDLLELGTGTSDHHRADA